MQGEGLLYACPVTLFAKQALLTTTRCILMDLWLSLRSAAICEKRDHKRGSVVTKQSLEWQTCQQFLEQNFYRNLLSFILFWKKMSPQVSV